MFVPSNKACEILGVHPNTLRAWADEGQIEYFRTAAGHRRYDVASYLRKSQPRARLLYARVSSKKQKEDLQGQVRELTGRYPNDEVIEDYGSGLNFKRKGFTSLLDRLLSGDVSEVVVAHRDRLCRFGFGMFEHIAAKHNGRIVVLNNTELSAQAELVEGILSIIHVFSSRLYGLRKYRNKIKEDSDIPASTIEESDETVSGVE
jgi:predicted site-specific integrase-resolvase